MHLSLENSSGLEIPMASYFPGTSVLKTKFANSRTFHDWEQPLTNSRTLP